MLWRPEHGSSRWWQRKQLLFKMRTETHDPNQIQQHLQEHPFHSEALLQMSKIYAMTQQYDASAMLLRRCLFVLEHAWHKGFLRDIQEGCARMDYDGASSENACFLGIALLPFGPAIAAIQDNDFLVATADPVARGP